MTKPRPWTTETLMKRVNEFVDGTLLTESNTISDLFDEMENTIVFEKTGVARRRSSQKTTSHIELPLKVNDEDLPFDIDDDGLPV